MNAENDGINLAAYACWVDPSLSDETAASPSPPTVAAARPDKAGRRWAVSVGHRQLFSEVPHQRRPGPVDLEYQPSDRRPLGRH
jgi:hypothetical protein